MSEASGMSLEQMLLDDNERMRAAGCKLAEAAIRVAREYDGIHRLLLAVSEWTQAIADEGGRPHGTGTTEPDKEK